MCNEITWRILRRIRERSNLFENYDRRSSGDDSDFERRAYWVSWILLMHETVPIIIDARDSPIVNRRGWPASIALRTRYLLFLPYLTIKTPLKILQASTNQLPHILPSQSYSLHRSCIRKQTSWIGEVLFCCRNAKSTERIFGRHRSCWDLDCAHIRINHPFGI